MLKWSLRCSADKRELKEALVEKTFCLVRHVLEIPINAQENSGGQRTVCVRVCPVCEHK